MSKNQCEICGNDFIPMTHAHSRKYCYECSPHEDENMSHADAVTIKRKAVKKMLINMGGGKCQKCGYDKCVRALEFHHLDPNEKDFGISKNLSKNIQELKDEVNKCILLCSNCHAEEHDRLFREGYGQFDCN